MFHRFKLSTPRPNPELVAVGIVMPSGVCHIEWLEESHLSEGEDPVKQYNTGIAKVVTDVFAEGYKFQWLEDPQEVMNPKLKTEFEIDEYVNEVQK